MFLGPQTEWSCCLGWSWQKGPADKSRIAHVPAAGPRRTSIPLRPGHLALSDPHSGRSSVQWGHESLKVDLHVAWAHKGARRSSAGQEMALKYLFLWFTLLVKIHTVRNPCLKVSSGYQLLFKQYDSPNKSSQINGTEAEWHFIFKDKKDLPVASCPDAFTGCGLYLPPLSLQSPDSWQ